jgi:drug/metabolite transporter (DMT)-like permease
MPKGDLFSEHLLVPNLAIIGSALLWGTLWIPLRAADASGWSRAAATTGSLLVPLVLLLPFAVGRRRRILAGGWSFPCVALCLALSISLYAEGVVRGHVAPVILLFYLMPVWGTLLARVLLGEAVTPRRFLTIALGLTGMGVILGVGDRIPLPRATAEWMGLAAGILWAFSMIYVNRSASRPVFDRVFVQFTFLAPTFFLVTLVPGGEGDLSLASADPIGSVSWLLALALIWILPVIWLTIFGASHLDPGRVGILLMLEIVVALTSAALLTDEPFGVRESVGAVFIMGAAAVEITARAGCSSWGTSRTEGRRLDP